MIKRILTSLGDFDKNNNALKLSIVLALQHNAHVTGLTPLSLAEDEGLGPVPLSTRVLGGSSYTPDHSEFIKSATKSQNLFSVECKNNHLSHEIIRPHNQKNFSITSIISSHDLFVLGEDPEFFNFLADDFYHLLNPIVTKASRPILIARNATLLSGDIVVAFDGSAASSRAVQIAFLMGFYINKKVHLINVNDNKLASREQLKWIELFLQAHGVSFNAVSLISQENTSKVILDFIAQFKISLVILGASDKKRLESFFIESARKELIESPHTPSIFLYS